MATFDKNSEAVLSQAEELAATAAKMKLSVNNLMSTATASFHYEEGDQVTITSQLASIVPLSGTALERAKAADSAQGYFAFDAIAKRGKKEIPCHISAKQLFTPTVWETAETLDGIELLDNDGNVRVDSEGNPIQLFCAPRAAAKKRFGEWGAPATVQGIPVIEKEITFKVTLQDVFVSQFLNDEEDRKKVPAQNTALVKRTNYAVAL